LGDDYVSLGPSHSVLHLAPLVFDASTFEIWAPILHGARLFLFPPMLPSPDLLQGILDLYQVDTLWLTSSLFNAVIDHAPLSLSSVRRLLVGGEALSPSHISTAMVMLPHLQLINGSVPTEATTFSCCYPLSVSQEPTPSIPIGKPIANTQAFILDKDLQPA